MCASSDWRAALLACTCYESPQAPAHVYTLVSTTRVCGGRMLAPPRSVSQLYCSACMSQGSVLLMYLLLLVRELFLVYVAVAVTCLHRGCVCAVFLCACRGIIYFSRLPPFMKPAKLRHLMTQYGNVDRVFCKPEGSWNARTHARTHVFSERSAKYYNVCVHVARPFTLCFSALTR